MEWCDAGKHAAVEPKRAFSYAGKTWCPDHRPPVSSTDPVPAGLCTLATTPHSADHVWFIPTLGKWGCRRHRDSLIAEVVRRGMFGK